MNAQATELIRCMLSTPCSVRGISSLVPGLHKLRVSCVRARDRASLLALAEHVLDWVQHATAAVRAHACLEIAEMLAEDLGHRETPARLYERALALTPTDFSVTDRARRTLEGTDHQHRVEWLFALQARTLESAPGATPSIMRAAWSRLAALRQSQGQLDAAIKAYDIAVDLEPCVDDLRALSALLERRGTAEDRHDAAELRVLIAELAADAPQESDHERPGVDLPSRETALANTIALHAPALCVPSADQLPLESGYHLVCDAEVAVIDELSAALVNLPLSGQAHKLRGRIETVTPRRVPAFLMAAALVAAAALIWTLEAKVMDPARAPLAAATYASDQRAARPAPELRALVAHEAAPPALPLVSSDSLISQAVAEPAAAVAALPVVAPANAPAAPPPGFVARLKSVRGGHMRVRALQRALAQTLVGADACYAEARAAAPSRQVQLTLTWLVSKSGRVSWVRTQEHAPSRATRCASRALKAAQFPRPKGGATRIEGVLSIAPTAARCELDAGLRARDCVRGS